MKRLQTPINRVSHYSLFLVVGLLVALPDLATAQSTADPPGRVARLNYIQGPISFQLAGTQDWVDASPNRPLTTGDNLWADQDARGELHIGSTSLHLASQTGMSLLNLTDKTVQLQLAQGSLDLRLRTLGPDEAFEVDTANVAFTLLRPGEYRIDVDPDGTTTVITVRDGDGEVTGGGTAYNLKPGQQYTFTGSTALTYDAQPAPARSAFDTWSRTRDEREDHAVSAHYVSRDVIGYEDLDPYGAWREDPEYGAVWFPTGVAVGWAPYRYGHWVYVAPWGWTWIEDEPWGFAPFHYGRWALVGGVWGWVPGPVVVVGVAARPVYAPALVGFVGGGRFSVSVTIGGGAGVAWFPLGPRDVWVPAYHASPRYVQNVNVTNTRVVNVTQITNVYNTSTRNVNVTNNYTYMHNTTAVTAVSHDTFVNGRPVSRSAVHVTPEQIQHPRVIHNVPVRPTLGSRVGPTTPARVAPPAVLANRPIVTKLAPSPRAVPIGHRQPLVTAHARPGSPPPVQTERSAHPTTSGQPRKFQPPVHANANPNHVAPPKKVQPPSTGPTEETQTTPAQPRKFQPPVHANVNPNHVAPPEKVQPPTHTAISNAEGEAQAAHPSKPSALAEHSQERKLEKQPNNQPTRQLKEKPKPSKDKKDKEKDEEAGRP